MSRICLYYRALPEGDRFLPGDRFVRPFIRRMIRGKPVPSGVDRVFINLCRGLDRLGIPYTVNLPFARLEEDDRVGVLGRGRAALAGYDRSNPIVAGISLMTHPSEWPTLCEEYPVVTYLQHSHWANEVYRPYFGDRCKIWPVGIDTDDWRPLGTSKTVDFLIYDKLRWDVPRMHATLLEPIRARLDRLGLSHETLRYGAYAPNEYRAALSRAKAMIFLVEHESQGLACQECLASDVPVLAWDPGECLDPSRFAWGDPHIPATSVPFFDDRCGVRFASIDEFDRALSAFRERLESGQLAPREYILETLTLERCASAFVRYLDEARAWMPVPAAR